MNNKSDNRSNKITDVIIHTTEDLSDQQFAELSRKIHQQEGVVSMGRNAHTPRFLMVVYNAARTRAGHILRSVTKQGYHATLVGI